MSRRIYQILAAGIFVLCATMALGGQVLAQANSGGVPEAAAPDLQGRGHVAPAPQGPEQAAPEGDAQAGPDEPGAQGSCPDQRRPLQLIV